MKYVKLILVVELIWYAICAFISAEPNPFTWSIEGRFMFVSLGIATTLGALTYPGVL